MAEVTYTWRPTGGYYYNTKGTSASAANGFYFSGTRSCRMTMSFSELLTQLGLTAANGDTKKVRIVSAVFSPHVTNAASKDTSKLHFSVETAWANRAQFIAGTELTGVTDLRTTGRKSIDITAQLQTVCDSGYTGSNIQFWGLSSGTMVDSARFRGWKPSSSYSSQRPYITVTMALKGCMIFTGGEWKAAVPYCYRNGLWKPADIKLFSGNVWN